MTDGIVRAQNNENLILWYDEPAKEWMTQALPIGNGYMGAMFFGGISEERIQFTEESLWTGGSGSHPEYNYGLRENAHQYLHKVRRLLEENKFEEAHQVANQLTGEIHEKPGSEPMFGDYGAQQTMGDLYIEIEQADNISNYQRKLDLQNSVGRVEYIAGNIQHSRTYFGSYPERTMVYHFENTTSQGVQKELQKNS